MHKLIVFLLFGIVLISSCETEVPPGDSEKAVFFIRGEINGNTIDLSAGDNGYYMQPFYDDDSLDIRSYAGKLGPYICIGDIDCPQSVQIFIREKEKNNGQREPVEESVFERICESRGPASYLFESYKASFFSKSFPTGMGHTWYFGDGVNSNDLNPIHYYLNESDSVVNPSLVVDNAGNGCQNSIGFQINFVAPCDVDFFPVFVAPQVTLNPYPSSGRSEMWSYNGDAYEPFTSKGPPTDSITLVCLESTQTSNYCVSYKCKNVVLDTANVGCVANYDVVKEKVTLKDVRDYLEVSLIWQNENGKIYRSDSFAQLEGDRFEILEVLDYQDSREGNATKKVTIKFDMRLFGESETDFVDFSSEKSVVAIAYPKI